ncbi:hypothetical protein [Geodermatophilus sp. CPCC 206100]|uniref:hypothetical protein n=1 Tax=Geodermatophilus sp. CPCC 206100 TaxID=3020054 RepID=UPI003B00EF01
METIEQHLWPLVVAEYPTVAADDYSAVYQAYGPAFGPWRPVAVGGADGAATVLAAGGLVDDPVTAMAAVAEDWRLLAGTPDRDRLPACPEQPTAGDVAREAPQGLLLRHGLARLEGGAPGLDVPADLPVATRPRRRK